MFEVGAEAEEKATFNLVYHLILEMSITIQVKEEVVEAEVVEEVPEEQREEWGVEEKPAIAKIHRMTTLPPIIIQLALEIVKGSIRNHLQY